MTFKELLLAKSHAETALDSCTFALDEARKALADAELKHAEAKTALEVAHQSIRGRLVERGDHHLTAPDGTLTVYRAVEPGDGHPQGWTYYQPLSGD